MSTILVDNLTGKTSAGDITVTSEGGAATQSLQQGLAKAWWQMNGSGTPAFGDSLNSSSITDNATGDYSVTFTNSMNNATYSALGACGRNGGSYLGGTVEIPGNAAATSSVIRFYSYNSSASTRDATFISGQINGDLA